MDSIHLKEVVKHENEFWSRVFDDEMKKSEAKNDQNFSSYWWESYYDEMTSYVKKILDKYQNPHILEAGCGSGKATILLGLNYKRTLLDISQKALDFARHLISKFGVRNVVVKEGDIFRLPFPEKNFEFVWNIGVIEHYDPDNIVDMLSEMVRVTKSGGTIAIGIPNFNSLPILKAKILRHPLLKFIPGYRLESELPYSEKELIKFIKDATKRNNRTISNTEVTYFGNPLFMESPKILIKTLGMFVESLMPQSKFLIFVTVHLK